MKIAFLCPALSRTVGGIFEIERRLAQSLALIPGTQLEVFGPDDEHTESDLPAWHPLKPRCFAGTGGKSFRYSAALRDEFLSTNADLAHLHALWMYNSILIHHWSQRTGSPYLVTPNGMLEPWALRNSGWKKKIASLLYERRMLSNAACIQANTEKEAADIRAFGLKNLICIIPNGIDLPVIPKAERLPGEGAGQMLHGPRKSEMLKEDKQAGATPHPDPLPGRSGEGILCAPWAGMIKPGRKVLLFLSRIHPKKGLVNLLRAWAALEKSGVRSQRSEWILAIAGWDQGGHEVELKRLCADLQIPFADLREQKLQPSAFSLQPSVLFLGPQFADDKAGCYQNCDAFVLPSFSEGLPMAVLEAWAYGKPVLMTPECNLPEGFTTNAAIRIGTSTEGIEQGLEELFRLQSSDLSSLGVHGRQLVASRFAWPKIAADMRSVYGWVLGGGAKPECVIA